MKLLPLFFLFLWLPLIGFGQDIIIRHDSTRIQAKVIEISPAEIKYKEFDNQEGPLIVIKRSEVYKIQYPNGKHTLLTEQNIPANTNPEAAPYIAPAPAVPAPVAKQTSAEMYNKGQLEALSYYKGNGAMWGTAAATLGFGLGGLLAGGIIAAVPPNVDKHPVSDRELLRDPNFRAGYKKQAHKRKVGKAAAGLGIGLAALIIYVSATAE